jgi:glycosyltransferase involved in cell wall biosynthesis
MRLLFVADGRSPIALNWIRYFVDRGDSVFLASTFDCSPDLGLEGLTITPVAFSRSRSKGLPAQGSTSRARQWRTALRHWLGPLTVARDARRLRDYAGQIRPDLVHAMRIPFEAMLAADAYGAAPLVVSVWGNDFTLHAASTPLMRHYTGWTLRVADALHADCKRDIRLARKWGLEPSKPTLVAPGGGGIRPDVFFPAKVPIAEPIVVNARGARSYVRNDVFFRAIPLVLAHVPAARFRCVAMANDPDAAAFVERLRIGHAVELMPALNQDELGQVLRSSQVMVSPALHDGTPNTLLEGMASGCFPIAGDLESIREWIRPGQNGLVVDPTNPEQLARAILRALEDKDLRREAAGRNQQLIHQRAEYSHCMGQVGEFYDDAIAAWRRAGS